MLEGGSEVRPSEPQAQQLDAWRASLADETSEVRLATLNKRAADLFIVEGVKVTAVKQAATTDMGERGGVAEAQSGSATPPRMQRCAA